jgi:hypothetical protein
MENQNSYMKVVITSLVCITIVIVSVIISGYLSSINDRNNMAKNMDSAIQKGIDPISVKCAYATQTDNLCMVYALKAK